MRASLIVTLPFLLLVVDAAPTTAQDPSVGLAINKDSKANVASFGGKLGWYYSWGLNPLAGTESLEFVPMVWGGAAADSFNVTKIPAGTKCILGFNERELFRQCAVTMKLIDQPICLTKMAAHNWLPH